MFRELVKKVPGARQAARILGLSKAPAEHRRFLLDMLPRDSVGAEVGVHLGRFSERLLRIVEPRKLYLIDPWEYRTSGDYTRGLYGGEADDGQENMDRRYAGVIRRFAPQIGRGQVIVERATSGDALAQLPDDHLDWVYIDGDHTYEAVVDDLSLSLRKVRRGGLICGDDYGLPGWWEDGVTKAVDAFSKHAQVTLLDLREGQFVFRRDA